jgi:hypothetical protein
MKVVGIMVLCLLVGCSARPTVDELEAEAVATGDWAAVEKRERMDRRMGLVDPSNQCPNGEALLCNKKGKHEDCECVSPDIIRAR